MATVKSMRRITAIVALLATLTATSPAAAHTCALPVRIEPGQPATVNIGVAAEDAAVVSVKVDVPKGFELDRVLEAPGWTSTMEAGVVLFAGGKIPPFGCSYFGVAGMAEKKATLAFPLTVGMEGGGERRLASHKLGAADSAQLVYAGTEPASAVDAGDEAGGTSRAAVVAVALAVASGLAAAAWAVRYALSGSTRRPPSSTRRPVAPGRGRPATGSSRRGSRKRQRPRYR